jgi:hypothetical protein
MVLLLCQLQVDDRVWGNEDFEAQRVGALTFLELSVDLDDGGKLLAKPFKKVMVMEYSAQFSSLIGATFGQEDELMT